MRQRLFESSLALAVLTLVIGLGLNIGTYWRSCAGLHDCYLQWLIFWGKGDAVTRERELLASQFTASERLIAFPSILEGDSIGLIVFDRVSQKTKLIYEEGFGLFFPFLSIDGERLLFVKRSVDGPNRDIMSCSVNSWRCEALAHTEGTVFSPAEISKDTIVYSSSPMVTGADKQQRYNRHDIVIAMRGGRKSKITSLGYYALDSISITKNSIFFSGINGPYEVFRADLPQPVDGEVVPIRPSAFLNPSTVPVVRVSASLDDQLVSFQRAETVNGKYKYHLNVVSSDGRPLGIARVDGVAMSRGTFINHNLLFNELYSDRYVVKQWNISNNTFLDIAEIEHEPSKLKLLERIPLMTDRAAIQ